MKIDTRIARFLSPLELQALGSDVIDARGMSTISTRAISRAQVPSSISVSGARPLRCTDQEAVEEVTR